MKNLMKKCISLLLASVVTAGSILTFASCNKKSVPVIGISQYGEHASLDNCRIGFLEGLKDAGLKEGTDYVIDYQNASFDDNVAIQIGQNFASKNVSLMLAIATPSATACYAAAEDKNIPVVFSAITDPVQAKLNTGNITGTSDQLPVKEQLELIRELQPDAKTIGILYTLSEPNSVSAIAVYQELAADYGFTIVAKGVTAQSEVTMAADTLISEGVDCLSNLTDNNVVGVLPAILDKTNEAGIPIYGSEIEQVKKGCVAAAGLDYVQLGRQTAVIAVKILKGEAKASEIPYETISECGLYINKAAIAEMELQLPESLSARAESVTADAASSSAN